jgi:hypothetical protein
MEDAQPDCDLTDNEVPNVAQYVLVFPFDASTVLLWAGSVFIRVFFNVMREKCEGKQKASALSDISEQYVFF